MAVWGAYRAVVRVSSSLQPKHRLLLAAVALSVTRLSCSVPPPDIAVYFGTKTRYEDVVRPGRSVSCSPAAEGCSPVHLSAVIRHGSRYPTVKNIRRIQRLSELVRRESARAPGSEGWLQELQAEWEQWYTEDMDGKLVEKGKADLRNLAMRLVRLFPRLLSEEALRERRVSVKTSSKHRCVSSAEAFQDGLRQAGTQTGTWTGDYIHEVDDLLLRFFERCRGYMEGVESNRTALMEVERFKQGPELKTVLNRVSIRLGLGPDRLTPDLLEAAFFLCSYELSIKSLHSPWCHLFTEEDAKVLEYKSDLKQYWKRAYGYAINGFSSCPLFHHIFRTLDKAGRPRRSTDAPPEPASILIGHGETLLPLISLLGLYKDKTPPTAANYQSQHERLFRSSLLVPYAANLLFVLYDCPRGPRLQLLLNESPVRFPGLDQDLPLYRDVRATYRHLLDGCDFYRECEGRPNRAPNTEL